MRNRSAIEKSMFYPPSTSSIKIVQRARIGIKNLLENKITKLLFPTEKNEIYNVFHLWLSFVKRDSGD